jgi:hypothetical protein
MPRNDSIAEAHCCCSGRTQSFSGWFEAVHWTRQEARALAEAGGFHAVCEDSHLGGLTVIGEMKDQNGRLLDFEPLIELRILWPGSRSNGPEAVDPVYRTLRRV